MKIRDPNLTSDSLKKERENVALPPLETVTVNSSKNPYLFWFVWTAALSIITLLGYVVGRFIALMVMSQLMLYIKFFLWKHFGLV